MDAYESISNLVKDTDRQLFNKKSPAYLRTFLLTGMKSGLQTAFDLFKEAEEQAWVSVNESLAPEHVNVLVQFGDENVLVGVMDENEQWAIYYSDGRKGEDPDRPVLYWRELPKPKKANTL